MPRKITSGKVGRSVLGDIFTEDNSIKSVVNNSNIVLEPAGTGLTESLTDIQINGTNGVRLADSDSSNYLRLTAPAAVTSNYTIAFPAAQGTANQILANDGSGSLTWENPSLTITNRSAADNATYYVTMADSTTGRETDLSVAGGRLEFVPNPGRLSTNELRVTSSTASSSTSSGALVVSGGVGVAGQITAVTIVETSSIAYKENISPITNALDSILNLNGVTYDRKDGSTINEAGLIAESVAEVLPNIVSFKDDKPEGISYTKLTAYLIEAIKDLKQEINDLKGI